MTKLSGSFTLRGRVIHCRTWASFLSRGFTVATVACLLAATLASARADDGWDGQILFFNWENDAVASSDRHYTQGAHIGYFARDNAFPRWLDHLSAGIPSFGYDTAAQKWGIVLGQEIYTPDNLNTATLITADRPYAGWLYTSLALQRRGPTARARPVMESFRLDLGIVGPESLAEETQKEWHGADPRGWNHQLRTEPGIALRYERRYLFAFRTANDTWGADFIPAAHASLGNVSTALGLSALARLGYQMPNEFATGHQPPRFGAYIFGGVDGRYVIRNIFLDGNTFRDSHSVDKVPFVADLKAGLAVVLKNVELSASVVLRTREFDRQNEADSFGSATVTFKF